MKAAQAVPKPMPKAKHSITDRASQGLPKAFRDPSFKDKTRIRAEDHGLGVSKTLKPNPAPVVNINIFGSGPSSSSGAWACIILCFSPGVSVLQMLVLVLFFFWNPADGISGLMPLLATHPVPPPGPSPPAGDVVTPGPILQELSDTTDEEGKGKGKIRGKGHGKGDGKRKDQSKDSES